MERTLKGFLGMLTVIALVVLAGGYVYAASQPVAPLQAHIPNTTDYALMNLKINLQCTEQETEVITGTTATATTKKYTIHEKDIIQVLSGHTDSCVASGAFPSDINKAKLYYQYSGSAFVVKVSDGHSTADISNTCMVLGQMSPLIYAGSENVITTTNTAKFTMLFDVGMNIIVPGTASADGFVFYFHGTTQENLNLPKLNKGKQTLTDSWNASGGGYGAAYIHTAAKEVYCTGTVHASGNYKREQ